MTTVTGCTTHRPGRFLMLIRHFIALLLLFGTITGVALWAQTSSGTITGLVVDEKNGVVGGAEVTITGADGTFTTKTTTSNDGIYSVPSIPPGLYTVLIQAKGFSQNKISQVNVTVGGVTKADAVLTVGSVTETVTVTSEGELLTPTSATIQTTIDQS